ncbi:MAG: membrane protein [Sulfurovum sp. PC08-66]|jgi:putative membrane protein|nr:MAG: membrane protein [Sulfurovum sp. PC08-66]
MASYYLWIVAFHVLSVLSWMAMLFYLPRLFVYHREHNDKAEFVEVVQIQEYKLYKYIGVPAMWAAILSGGALLYINSAIMTSGGWMHAKLLFVFLLIAYSFSLDYMRKKLIQDKEYKSGKFFRFYNEVPTFLAIGIVIFVVVKPF